MKLKDACKSFLAKHQSLQPEARDQNVARDEYMPDRDATTFDFNDAGVVDARCAGRADGSSGNADLQGPQHSDRNKM